jgi:hypothetical protein
MPGWGGFAELVAGFFLPKEGLAAFLKRRQLAALRKEANDALDRNDFVEHARLIAELRRVSDEA